MDFFNHDKNHIIKQLVLQPINQSNSKKFQSSLTEFLVTSCSLSWAFLPFFGLISR